MIVIQLGASSRRTWLFVAGLVLSACFFAWSWALWRHWVAAALAIVALVGAVRLGFVIRRRDLLQSRATVVARGERHVSALDGALFAVFGQGTVGRLHARGVVLASPSIAVFVPMEPWTHIGWALLTGFATAFARHHREFDLGVELANHGNLDEALAELATERGGFVIDDAWTLGPLHRSLNRHTTPVGVLSVEYALPPAVTRRWAATPRLSIDRWRTIRSRVIAATVGVVGILVGIGIIAWRLTGNADLLVAFALYGAVFGIASGVALVAVKRRGWVTRSRQGESDSSVP